MTFSSFSKLMGYQSEHLAPLWLCVGVCVFTTNKTVQPIFIALTDAAMYYDMFQEHVLWPNTVTYMINISINLPRPRQ